MGEIYIFSIEIWTAGQIVMKFGMEVVLEGRKVVGGGGWPGTPHYPGMECVKGLKGFSGASVVHFGKNFTKQGQDWS